MKKSQLKLIALGAVAAVLPVFLPRRSRVVRRMVIRAKPEEVFPFINDLRNWPLWTEWSRRDEIHFSYEGSPAGVGAVQRWETRCMHGVLKIVQSMPDDRIAYHLNIGDGRYQIDGGLALDPVAGVTRVTWFCKWDSGPNIYARYMDAVLRIMVGRDFAAGLANLKELVEDRAEA